MNADELKKYLHRGNLDLDNAEVYRGIASDLLNHVRTLALWLDNGATICRTGEYGAKCLVLSEGDDGSVVCTGNLTVTFPYGVGIPDIRSEEYHDLQYTFTNPAQIRHKSMEEFVSLAKAEQGIEHEVKEATLGKVEVLKVGESKYNPEHHDKPE